MNTARSMGNSLEKKNIPELIRAFKENKDERVKGMCAWALGRLGGDDSKAALEECGGEPAEAIIKLMSEKS